MAVWLSLCLSITPVRSSPADDFPQENFWWRFSPGAVFCGDPTSTTRLEVHIEGRTDVAGAMSAYYFYGGRSRAGHFASNGDGTWRLIPNTTDERFSMLDLYLMGLADPWEVPEVNILKNPDVNDPNRVVPEGVTTYIDELCLPLGRELLLPYLLLVHARTRRSVFLPAL